MPRILLVLISISFFAACATRPEFKRTNPEKIAVVIGYEVVGNKTLHPAFGFAAYLATTIALLPVSPFAPLIGEIANGAVNVAGYSEKGEVTMVDVLNSSIYRGLEEKLLAKGYKPRLLKTVPISFAKWQTVAMPADFYSHTGEYYGLGEQELQAIDADAILLVEYRVDAYVKDAEELLSMDAADLKVDYLHRIARAYSLKRDSKLIYNLSTVRTRSAISRMDFERTLEHLTFLEVPVRAE